MALAVGLATTVIVAMYVLRVHALRVEPGLLRVKIGWVHSSMTDELTVTVRSRGRLVRVVALDDRGNALIPDLAPGTYQVAVSHLDFPIAAKTVEVGSGTWWRTLNLPFYPPPPGARWRRIPASRPDATDRAVAREVYGLVVGYLTDRIGSRAIIERETAAPEGVPFQSAAHGIIPLAESIRLALREPTRLQVVWHHHGIFPPAVTVMNKADVPATVEQFNQWRARLGLSKTQNVHVFSVSRVFVSDEGTQALVFAHDWDAKGEVFWMKRPSVAGPWLIERVDLLWIS